MECQNCGQQLPDFPEDAVEDGVLDEVVAYEHSDVEGPYVSEKLYCCDPDCFKEAVS